MEILATSISRDKAETVRGKPHQAKSWVCDCQGDLRSQLLKTDYKMDTQKEVSLLKLIKITRKNVILYLSGKSQAQDKHGILKHLLPSQPPNLTPCTTFIQEKTKELDEKTISQRMGKFINKNFLIHRQAFSIFILVTFQIVLLLQTLKTVILVLSE